MSRLTRQRCVEIIIIKVLKIKSLDNAEVGNFPKAFSCFCSLLPKLHFICHHAIFAAVANEFFLRCLGARARNLYLGTWRVREHVKVPRAMNPFFNFSR